MKIEDQMSREEVERALRHARRRVRFYEAALFEGGDPWGLVRYDRARTGLPEASAQVSRLEAALRKWEVERDDPDRATWALCHARFRIAVNRARLEPVSPRQARKALADARKREAALLARPKAETDSVAATVCRVAGPVAASGWPRTPARRPS